MSVSKDLKRRLISVSGTYPSFTQLPNLFRTKGIQVHLMGMATPHEVEEDLQVVREALGLVTSPNEAQEQAALKEIQALFEPIKDQTWHTGRHNNRT